MSPAADGQMGCHDWSLDGLRVTVVEPQNALLVTSAARVDPRQFPYPGSCKALTVIDVKCVISRFTFRGVPGYRRDSFSAKLRRHGIPDTAVYGKGVRFVLRGFVTGVIVPAIRPHRRGMCAIGPGHATRQPSAGGTIPVLPRLPYPSFIIYIAAPPSLRVA